MTEEHSAAAAAKKEQPALYANARPHTPVDDAYAFFTGMSLIAIGVMLLKAAGLVTAGVAGLSLTLSYLIKLPVGVLFTLVNLPFFAFGAIVMGRTFILKSVFSSFVVSFGMILAAHWMTISGIAVPFAAIAGGTTIGTGILIFARHGAGIGGTLIVSLWLNKVRGINVGIVALFIDLTILASAALVVTPITLLWSALSAACIHLTLFAWHRPGRYIGY